MGMESGAGLGVHTSYACELTRISWPVLGLSFPKQRLGPEVKAWEALQAPRGAVTPSSSLGCPLVPPPRPRAPPGINQITTDLVPQRR